MAKIENILEILDKTIDDLKLDLDVTNIIKNDLENENKRMKKTIEDLNGKIKEFEIGKGLD